MGKLYKIIILLSIFSYLNSYANAAYLRSMTVTKNVSKFSGDFNTLVETLQLSQEIVGELDLSEEQKLKIKSLLGGKIIISELNSRFRESLQSNQKELVDFFFERLRILQNLDNNFDDRFIFADKHLESLENILKDEKILREKMLSEFNSQLNRLERADFLDEEKLVKKLAERIIDLNDKKFVEEIDKISVRKMHILASELKESNLRIRTFSLHEFLESFLTDEDREKFNEILTEKRKSSIFRRCKSRKSVFTFSEQEEINRLFREFMLDKSKYPDISKNTRGMVVWTMLQWIQML